MEKLLSALLAGTVCASAVSVFQPAVFAETMGVYEVYNGEMHYVIHDDGTAEITDFQRTSLCLEAIHPVIPEEIDGAAVTRIADEAFKYNDVVSGVTIPATVTSIGKNAFTGTFLNTICYGGSYAQWNEIEIDEGNDYVLNAKIEYIIDGISYFILEDGTASLSGYDSAEGAVVIPDTLEGFKVSEIRDRSLDGMDAITEVTVSEGITRIGENAFTDCNSLEKINLPDSLEEIDEGAFMRCSSLKEITLPENLTSISEYTFYNCTSLSQVNLPDGIESIGENAFYNCDLLQSIVLPDSVSSIGKRAFYECSKLVDVTVPKNLAELGAEAFHYVWLDTLRQENGLAIVNNIIADGTDCTGDMVIPENVTGIADGAFKGSAVESVTVPASVQYMGSSIFSDCTALTSAVISEGVKALGQSMFSGCTALTAVSLPSTLVSIGSGAFSGCAALTEVALCDGLTSIGSSAFSNNVMLTELIIPDSVEALGTSLVSGCYRLKKLVLPEGLTEITQRTFYQCRALKELTVPLSVSNIAKDAFSEAHIRMNISYGGSEIAWRHITVDDGNDSVLVRATLIYGEEAVYGTGDIDGSTAIDLSDAQAVISAYAQSAAGLETGLSELQNAAADLDGDGAADLKDAGYILNYYAQNAAGMNPSWEDIIGA